MIVNVPRDVISEIPDVDHARVICFATEILTWSWTDDDLKHEKLLKHVIIFNCLYLERSFWSDHAARIGPSYSYFWYSIIAQYIYERRSKSPRNGRVVK